MYKNTEIKFTIKKDLMTNRISKAKLTLLLLGGLLISNADLQAARKQIPEPSVKPEKTESVVQENAGTAEVDEDSQAATKRDLQGLTSDVAVLRDQLTRQLDSNIANTARSLTIGGTLQNRYTAVTSTNQPTSPNGFTVNAAILSFSGALKKDYEEGRNLTYALSLISTAATNTFQPYDAYLQYAIFPSLDIEKPNFNITFGQQAIPFGLEPQVGEDKKPAAVYAIFAGANGWNLAQRDLGVQLKGDLFPFVDLAYTYRVPLIQYQLGIFNGSNWNTAETNKSKDVVGRIVLNAPVDYNSDFRGLSIGSSFYSGEKDLAQSNGTLITGGSGKGTRNRYGADIAYVASPFGFTAEYAVGDDDRVISGTTIANAVKSTIKSKAYTATLFYEWGEQFLNQVRNQSRLDDWWPKTYQPFIRYDYFDPDTSVANNESSVLTYGFNFFFAQTTKLQLNYNVSNLKNTNVKQSQFIAQFQFGF